MKIERNRCMTDIQQFLKDKQTKEIENTPRLPENVSGHKTRLQNI